MLDKLKKALDTVSLGYSSGTVSADILIKSCDTYKEKTGFKDTYEYQIFVAKSLFDSLNNIEPDLEILKAIVPGQTKMVDGVMYIYTATPNAKTPYDWRVLKKGNKNIGRGNDLDNLATLHKQKFVNELFPKDLSTLKVVKQLGGSTGAVLVKDLNGNEYVMKKGGNTSNEHVKSEYEANQLYDALGIRVPDYELYEENGEAILLSKYIPMTSQTTLSDYPEMAKGFIADVLLANWDVYQNDNCLKDSAGRIIRVDNGSCLEYRAQGNKKSPAFDGNVLKTFKDMKRYNPSIFSQVDENELLSQISEIKNKRDIVVNFLEESGNTSIANIISERFKNLSEIESLLNKSLAISGKVVVPRQLKPESEMYRDFTDDELEDFWKNTYGSTYYSKLKSTDSGGWELLKTMCISRGFDARPRVVEEDEYWKIVSKAKHPQLFRGLDNASSLSQEECVASFKYDDDCFYGSYGVYGEGIYAHVNDGDKNKDNTELSYQKSDAYKHALAQYAGGRKEGVLFLAYEDDIKIANVDDLQREILNNPPSGNTKETKKIKTEIQDIIDGIKSEEDILSNISNNTVLEVYANMHYDALAITDMQFEIENTDWGSRNEEGEPDFPSWDDFVENKMSNWIKANGGSVNIESDVIYFKLPNSKTEFHLTKYQYNGPSSIKQKNSFTKPYNYAVERFENWVMTEHVSKVEKAKKEAVNDLGDSITNLKKNIDKLKTDLTNKQNELSKISSPTPDSDIYSAIYTDVHNGNKEAIGIYAAIKGYDALYTPHGNGSSNGFAVILNRSKVIVKK